jgi:hypothetical protein
MLKRERKAKRTRMTERRRKREKRKRREPNNYNFRDQKLIFFHPNVQQLIFFRLKSPRIFFRHSSEQIFWKLFNCCAFTNRQE